VHRTRIIETGVAERIDAVTIDKRLSILAYKGPGFDEIRFLAATTVLIHHCRVVEYSDIRVDPLFLFSNGEIHFGFLAVAIFFSISGFLVTPGLLRSQNVLNFAANRIARIFPALVIVVLASMFLLGPIITNYSLPAYFSDPLLYRYGKNITTFLSNFLPGVTSGTEGKPAVVNAALWTLNLEVLCYAALAFASIIGMLRRRKLFLVLFIGSYAINAIVGLFPSVEAVFSGRLASFIGLFVYFAAGATLFLYANLVPFSSVLAGVALASTLVALPFGFGLLVTPLSVPYLVVYAGLSALPGRSLLKPDVSYGIYLIHAPILLTLSIFFPGVHNRWLMASIVFPVTLVLAYLSWSFVEAPSLRHKANLSAALRNAVRLVCSPLNILHAQSLSLGVLTESQKPNVRGPGATPAETAE
jgi:peptidoglycan/LPS O-acetylase OafA/YrhL